MPLCLTKFKLIYALFLFRYESSDPIVRFTEPQLAEIRKVLLSKVFCDNLDLAGDIQRSALDQPSDFL